MVQLRLWYAVLFAVITVGLACTGIFLSGQLSTGVFEASLNGPGGELRIDDRKMMLIAVTLLAFSILGVVHTILAFVTWNLCRIRQKYEWVQFLSALDAMVLPLGTIIGLKTLTWLADDKIKASFEAQSR